MVVHARLSLHSNKSACSPSHFTLPVHFLSYKPLLYCTHHNSLFQFGTPRDNQAISIIAWGSGINAQDWSRLSCWHVTHPLNLELAGHQLRISHTISACVFMSTFSEADSTDHIALPHAPNGHYSDYDKHQWNRTGSLAHSDSRYSSEQQDRSSTSQTPT